jgi:hypothetical protein
LIKKDEPMRPINRCLNKQLAELCQRSVQLEELSLKLNQLLPEHLIGICQVGSFNKGFLTLTAPNNEWAFQLKYLLPELRDKLRLEGGFHQLTSIKIATPKTIINNSTPLQQKKYSLSPESKALIISESQQCQYEPLQKALLHLAEE